MRSLKSISVTADTIRKPTNTSAGAIAKPGMAINTGDRNIATRKRSPVTIDERPVLPPSATPEELSTNVVVVDVPRIAPALVAIASAKRACLMRGSFPSLSSIFALLATPMSVPSVSKISTKRNANMIITKSRTLMFCPLRLKHCPNVLPIAVRSKLDHCGSRLVP